MSDLPDSRELHGHTIEPHGTETGPGYEERLMVKIDRFSINAGALREYIEDRKEAADFDDGTMHGALASLRDVTYDISLIDGPVTLSELEDIADTIEEMEEEYFSDDEPETFLDEVKELVNWDEKGDLEGDEAELSEYNDDLVYLTMKYGTDEDVWEALMESDEVKVTNVDGVTVEDSSRSDIESVRVEVERA